MTAPDTHPHITPRCPVFGLCGGCQLQEMSYGAQLRLKESRLREALARSIALEGIDILPMVPAAAPWNYRRRVQVHRNPKGEVGFYSESTHDLVPIERCEIAHPAINEAIAALRASPAPQALQRIELVWDEVRQVVHHYGEDAEAVFFTQVNPEQNAVLQEIVVDWVQPKKGSRILELYAGAGNFTLRLADRGASVTAVEASEEAVRRGRREGGRRSIDWMPMGVRQALKSLIPSSNSFDLCLLDPPRAGLKDCAALLEAFDVDRLLYISCNPDALARDLNVLTANRRYRVARILPIDFFPQTDHMEVLCELISTRPRKPVVKSRPIRF